jgi:hypothetical protein
VSIRIGRISGRFGQRDPDESAGEAVPTTKSLCGSSIQKALREKTFYSSYNMESSTSKAALSAFRQAPQLGQKSRRLQLNATGFSSWQDLQRILC